MTRPADLTDLDQRIEQIADLVAEVRCPNPFPLPRYLDDQLMLIDLELTALLVVLRHNDAEGVWECTTDDGSFIDFYDDEIDGLLEAMTADGPVFSADGSLAVHRTDPELAAQLNAIADLREAAGFTDEADALRRAAALLAAPAPADPEEDGE